VLEWDERTCLPPAAGEYRAAQLSTLAGLVHDRWTDARFGGLLQELAHSSLVADPMSDEAVTLRELLREHGKKTKLPKSLVEELARTSVIGQRVWVEARRENDFDLLRPSLERLVQLKRDEADALGYTDTPYDALLDEFEPQASTRQIAAVFAALARDLAPLVWAITASVRRPDLTVLFRSYAIETQQNFALEAARRIGFDFDRGRLDTTAHPFCTHLGPHDVRLTTRYDAHDFSQAFFGVLHEAGHGLYEQGLRSELFGLPLGDAVSLGIHESQSRLWENLVGRSQAFWEFYFPQAQQMFASLRDVEFTDFFFAINDVRPSLIRVEADEVTYNMHIFVRFELEQALLTGDLAVADLPGAWCQKYREHLGIEPANNSSGVLQDIHWSGGAIGYFPTYTLGNLYAAQFFEQAERDIGPLDEQFRRGDFAPLLSWLRAKIHTVGRRYRASELVERVTGRPLSHEPLVRHLWRKFGPLYELDAQAQAVR
jgi:carboxypeptidase Taq